LFKTATADAQLEHAAEVARGLLRVINTRGMVDKQRVAILAVRSGFFARRNRQAATGIGTTP